MRNFFATIIVFLFCATAAPLAAHELDGTWSFNVTTAAGSGVATLTMMVEGNAIKGKYSGQVGEADLSGTVDGSNVEISFDSELVGTVVYKGTLGEGAIKGTCNYGQIGAGTFEAKKSGG
jgi:hypothetical protein